MLSKEFEGFFSAESTGLKKKRNKKKHGGLLITSALHAIQIFLQVAKYFAATVLSISPCKHISTP